jgi:hypothetical protein
MMLVKEDNVYPMKRYSSKREKYSVVKSGYKFQVVERSTSRVISTWEDRETAKKQSAVLNRIK